MRRLTMVAVSLIAVTGLSAFGQDAAKVPTPPTFSVPDGRTPISIPGPMILQIGPPPSVYSPAADFKARIGNAATVAVLSDDGTQAQSNVVQITDIQADPTNPAPMQAFSLPGFSPTAMPPLPPPGYFVQVPTGYMSPPPAYLPVATRLSFPSSSSYPTSGGFPTCDAAPTCSGDCCCQSGECSCHAGTPPCPSDSCTAVSGADRLEHILEAAHHLEAAGLQADADQLRRRCDDDVKVLIHDLKAAESELAQLRRESFNTSTSMRDPNSGPGLCDVAATSTNKTVKVHVQLLELNRTKMRDLGIDFTAIQDGKITGSCNVGILGALGHCSSQSDPSCGDAISTFVNALKQDGVVKVLSEPTIVTKDGQLAEIFIGQALPFVTTSNDGSCAVNYKNIGSQLKIRPTIGADDKVRLQMECNFSSLKGPDETLQLCDPASQIDERRFETALEVNSGDTGLISGLNSMRAVTKTVEEMDDNHLVKSDIKEAIETEYVVLVRPEIVDGGEAAPPVAAIRAALNERRLPNLTWHPIRVTAATPFTAETVAFDEPVDSSTSTTCCCESAAIHCDANLECCGDATQCLKRPGIESQKSSRPFSNGAEIHFEQSPTPQPYEIDPATFGDKVLPSGPWMFGGFCVGVGR